MVKFIASTRKSMEFVTDKLWKVRINKIDKRQGFFIRQVRVFSLATKGFMDDDCFTAATALTFFTLFSIVPILALVFAIAKGFGYEQTLEQQILAGNAEYSEVLTKAFEYANVMLASTKGGLIAGFGILLLLWSIMKLLVNIENIFNHIWEVKVGRNWLRKITDYLTIMLSGPLFLIVSGGLSAAVETGLLGAQFLGPVGAALMKIFALGILALLFSFIYVALPNTKVHFRHAFPAAVISAILFQLLGWGYVGFQVGVHRMNAIYGGFAALPLFLIWVQYCWYIVLFGSELAYSYQNVDHYELEDDVKNLSGRYKKVISLMIAGVVAKRFYNREPALNAADISEKLDLPSRLTRNILSDFVETGIFVEVRTEKEKDIIYQPGVTESVFTVQYVLDTLEKRGLNTLPISDTSEIQQINDLFQELDKTFDTTLGHVMVRDLVKGN